jgi:hypothetical protein
VRARLGRRLLRVRAEVEIPGIFVPNFSYVELYWPKIIGLGHASKDGKKTPKTGKFKGEI